MSNLFRVDVPMNPSPSEDNVIANTKLLRDTVGWTCKNLFSPHNAHLNCSLVTTLGTDLTYIESSNGGLTYVAEIETDTDYTVSKKIGVGNRFEIALFTTEPTIPNTTLEANSTFLSGSTNPYTFNSENYHWVAFTVNDDTGDPSTIAETVEAMIRRADLLEDDYEPYHIDVNTSLNMLNEHLEDSIMGVERNVEEVNTRVDNIFDYIYPIGSIYLSLDGTFDPNVSFGGTWLRIKDTFLYGAADSGAYTIGEDGGEKEHTLTVSEMPSHSHSYDVIKGIGSDIPMFYSGNNNEMYSYASSTSNEGGGQSHNNMPPYLCVNMWKRIADDYITDTPYYKKDETGIICTGTNEQSIKDAQGSCYCGMAVIYHQNTSTYRWTPFCISRAQTTSKAITYTNGRGSVYGKGASNFTLNGRKWYYSYSTAMQSNASELDNTDPSSLKFSWTYTGTSVSTPTIITAALKAFINSIYT